MTWARVVRRTIARTTASNEFYDVILELTPTKVPLCSNATPSGNYPCLSALYGYVTGDYNPNGSPLWILAAHQFFYGPNLADALYAYNSEAHPGGGFQFPWYNGSADYGGQNVANSILFHVVGDGTITVHTTNALSGASCTFSWATCDSGGAIVSVIASGVAAGSDVTYTISNSATAGCDHYFTMYFFQDNTGRGPGFTSMDWTAA